jgi:undecaprenyl pyrophosphate phosphatase UppP
MGGQGQAFDVAVHGGTLLAVIQYFSVRPGHMAVQARVR